MKKSEFKKLKASFRAMQLTPRRGVLDAEKKLLVLQLVGSGLSRREAAQFVECAHTTIGRTAARDPEFAAALRQAESISHLQAVNAVRGAMRDPKYWRAAAWMLERRSPEEYARRDPNSFTADQVMSLLARLYSETLPLLPAEKVAQFQGLFDEALDEVEAKSGRAEPDDDEAEEDARQRTHLASRDGAASGNGHVSGKNGLASVREAAPSGNGHHREEPAAADSMAGHNARLPADACAGRWPVPSTQYTVETTSDNGKLQPPVECPEALAEREDCIGRDPGRAKEIAVAQSDVQTLLAAGRFAGRGTMFSDVIRRFDPAQLHQPHQQGVGVERESDDRKGLPVNELQQASTKCTRTEKPRGGAITAPSLPSA